MQLRVFKVKLRKTHQIRKEAVHGVSSVSGASMAPKVLVQGAIQPTLQEHSRGSA